MIPLGEELEALEQALKDVEEAISNCRRLLRPYWEGRRALENTIGRTHHHEIETYEPWPGAEEREVVHVTGYDRKGSEARAPLFRQLDALRYDYGGLHKELAEWKLKRKSLSVVLSHLQRLKHLRQPPLFR